MAIKADDTFTDPNGTNLEDHVPSPTGTAWQVQNLASMDILGNECRNGTDNEMAKETTDITTANMKVEADCKSNDNKSVGGMGPMTRIPAGDVATAANRDGFSAVLEGAADKTGADVVLFRLDDGAATELGRFNGNFGNEVFVNVRLESDGDDHRVFVDNVLRIGPITDTAHNTNQFAGLHGHAISGVVTVDNFKSEDIFAEVPETFQSRKYVGIP